MKEKNTKGTSATDEGLNEGNPNTERTPIDPTRPEGLIGGTAQSNYEDEQEGTVQRNNNDEESSRH
jgi:hypothetical protein